MDADESQNLRHSGAFSAFYGWIYVVFSSVAAIVSYLRGGSSHLEALPVFPPEITNEGLEERLHLVTDGNASFLRAARAGNLEKVLDYLKGSIDINTSNANGLNALHLAAKEGHVNVVSELLKRGANVNATTKKGNSALHIASLAGQEEVVKLLVQKQANVNVQSQNGFTPLYMAAQENHDGVVRFLLANGANQSLATEDGFTPLAVALQQGHDKVVAVLLENDARGKVRLPALHIASKKDDCKAAALLLHSEHNPDVTSKSGFTPLHIAAHYGNSNIASLLLEKGADVNFPAKHQITPLHVAAKWGKSNMVKLLLEKGAKIDASTRDGLTPLHCAARSGHDQVVEQLLEKNAPITAKTKNGLAPLHMASQGDHVDSARILLYHKAPVDDVTVDYLTALHVAAHCGHVGVAKLLLDRRADPNARALNGFTPLHIACKKNRIKVVELLLKHGASIEATTESGLTPLHVASFMGCMNIVIYLIQHGANPDIPTVRGETPLHLAARANQTDIIRILLRNGAHVDAKARELQTALHIASRLGNADMVGLLLQHGAAVDAPTKDAYTPLHVAAREGQDEVAALLLDHGAALAAPTKKGFTPLHLAAKYGNLKVAQLLLQKDAPVDAQGKNGVTPLHVAAHYDHVNVALLLLEKGASPHSAARNGYTPLHVAARKDQMDIASSLLEYGAKPGAESRAGFTPLHLAAQEGHADLAALLVEHGADCDAKAKNGLTPMHLCAQEDRVEVATILAKHGASLDPTTKAGYTPLHVACHFGQTNMIRFLLRQGANVNATTSHGYTPLHQAAQQGHTLIINLLLEHRAAPNAITNQGQTALAIAQRLGYISVVETLKVVTETIVTTTTTTVTEEKYRVVAPETMHETFMSDSEDEAAEDNMLGDQSFRYLTADEMKSLGDDSLPIDVTRDERITESIHITREPGHAAPLTQEEERLSPTQAHTTEAVFVGNYAPDNVDLSRTPIHAGSLLSWDGDSCSSAYVLSPTKRMWRERFLVSFLVDARGGAMRGCRHSGVRVIIPPRKAQMPMRITCRYLRKEKLPHPPPLLEGEACASRILEVGPAGAKFLGPVILEVPHFASLRGKEREISILRSDNGETWKEHTLEASEEAVQEVLNESFEGEELSALEDLQTNRIVRILTTDFPQYFAVVSRTRQEVHAVGPEGGLLSSTVVPQVQAIFPEGALTKKIRVGLQAQPIPAELVTKLLGHRVAVSPIVTVEPRRRKFHKPITLTIPVPQAATKGMINQYAGDAPTLRLLCSITGGTNKAQWEDVTGSTPLTFVNDCVSFTTTVSARFWLMDCRQVSEATKFATELYAEAMHVPFMAKFVVFAKRLDPMEAQLRVFCMTDDKEDKTLESQEHFTEVAKSRDVEVLEKKSQYLEFGGNLVPVTKSGEQLQLQFQAFRENRLPFSVRVKDPHQEPLGRLAFMRQPRAARSTEPPQAPLCNLNIALPEYEASQNLSELVTLEKKYGFVEETGLAKPELIHRADLRLSDIARELGSDWPALAAQLDVPEQDVASIRTECPSDLAQQALLMLRLWMKRAGGRATGNNLEKGLRMINREDIVNKCMFNVELVTDDVEKAVAKVHLDQSGFDTFREELGTPKDTSLKRDASLDVSYDEQDLMKEAESAEETSSETGSVHEKHTGSEAKGTSKAIPGVGKGSPISAAIGRIVQGSSKEKAAARMAVEETFEEEPVLKTDSTEVTQQAALETGPTAPPRDPEKKSKREKSPKPQGPDYSLPRIRDSITPERDFTSTTDAVTVSSIREAVDASKEPAADGKLKKEKKKDKKEKSPSPPGPDYTLPRLRDTYTPPTNATTAGYARSALPEEDVTPKKDIAKTFSFKRRSKERSLSPDLTKTGENGSLGADISVQEQEKRAQKSPEGTIVEKVEKIVKETPGKIVEIVHIKRQRSSKSPEGKGSSGDKDRRRLPSSEVEVPDVAMGLEDVSNDTSEAEKKRKEQKETSPVKQSKKDLKDIPMAVDKDVELSGSDGKSMDTGFLSKMAKLPKKMFPRSGKASASDEEPSSLSESSPIAKKKSGKLPKSATLPKASEKPSKKPLHEIKSVDVEIDTSKFTTKGTKDALAKDGEGLETGADDIVKEPDGRFFSRIAKIPKKMFPRSSKTSSSEDEPSSASENLRSSKQKVKKEPKGDTTFKKKEKGIKVKQADTQKLSASVDLDIGSDTSLPAGVDIGVKKADKPGLPDIKFKKQSESIKTSFPSGFEVEGSVGEPMVDIDIREVKSQPRESLLTIEGKHPDIQSSDVELSLTSRETTVEWPDKAEDTIEIGTPEHGKTTKSGFMTKMARFPRKMFPHGFKGEVSVEEPSVSADGIHVSVPETELTLDRDQEIIVSDIIPREIGASMPEGVEGSIEMSAEDPSMPSEKSFISKMTKLPRKMFSHDSKSGVSVEGPSVVTKDVDIEFSQQELELKTSGKGSEMPETKLDVTLLAKKVTADLPDSAEGRIDASLDKLGKSAEDDFMSKVTKIPKQVLPQGANVETSVRDLSAAPLDVHVSVPKTQDELGVRANIPDKPQADFDAMPGKGVSVEIPESFEGRVEISHPGVSKPSDGGFMAKMAKLPKKMFPHSSKGSVSLEETSEDVGDIQMRMPEAHLRIDTKSFEIPEPEGGIALPSKEMAVDLPEGMEGQVEMSTPEIGKMSDESFMSKMAKIPKKIFPQGSKGSVSVEGAPEDIDVQVKMPEPHFKVDVKGPKKPDIAGDITLPDMKVAVDLPEGTERKVELSTPEMGKPSDRSFMSKMAKFPKKMFPHGSKGGISVEGAPEGVDAQVKMSEPHFKMDVKEPEKPDIEGDIALPDMKVAIDLPEGIEGKIEIPAPEIAKPSDKGFMSKMAKLPKKMFPHGSKGSISVEAPEGVGDVQVRMPEPHIKMDVKGLEKPEAHLKMDVKGLGKPEVEGHIALPAKKVDVHLPEGFEGKVETSTPEMGKPSDGGFMSKMAKLPKKMFPHGSKGSVSVEGTPEVIGDVQMRMPETHLKMDIKGFERPEVEGDIVLPGKTAAVDLPETLERKGNMPTPEVGRPSDGGFMSKMAKLPKKMFPHGSKGSVSIEGAPESVGDIHVKMPESHLTADIRGLGKPEVEGEIALPDKNVAVGMPDGMEGKVEISTPEIGKASDVGFMSKMAKLPKKMLPHGSKGSVTIEAPEAISEVQVKMPEAQLKMNVKGPEEPELEADIELPDKMVAVDFPESVDGKIGISTPEIAESSDGGFMSKMAKFPKKMFPHGSKGSVSVEGAPDGVGDIQVKMPESHLEVDIKGREKPEAEIALPDKKVVVDFPEGMEAKVEISTPEIGKPSDRGFMSKMAKLPKKMFPHGAKGNVTIEEAPEVASEVQVKVPEAHLKMELKGPEKPGFEGDIGLPNKKVAVNVPEGIDGKFEIGTPEIGKPLDGGFISKMAKLPKKMFPHGSKESSISVEGAPEIGDVHAEMPEAHLKIEGRSLEKPGLEADIGISDKTVHIDLPEGIEGKVEISGPEIGKPTDGGFMAKMAKLPKKMFPHGSKESSISVEGAPEIGDVHAKVPEAHLEVDVKGLEKPCIEADTGISDKTVGVDLPESIEGKVEMSGPEIGKPVDGGFMAKMTKLPKKMFPHGSKESSISVEGAGAIGDVHGEMPEAHLEVDVKGLEKPCIEADIGISDKTVGVDLPESIEGKVEMSGPEIGKPMDGGFMAKMAKLPKKMFSHGSKESSISVEGAGAIGDAHGKMPEAYLKLEGKGLEKPGLEADIGVPGETVGVDLSEGIEGKVGISAPEIGRPTDGGFMAKMAKLPKKMFPHGSKEGSISVEGAPEFGDAHAKMPEAHLEMDVKGLEKPCVEADIGIPDKTAGVDLPEGIEGKVEISAPEIGKPTDGGFMAKMAKLPKKVFPHGSKGGVSVEGAPDNVGDIQAKMPEVRLKVDAKSPERPDIQGDVVLPAKDVAVDLSESVEGKVEISAPDIGKQSDRGFMSKMAKLPKKMFPHGSKGSASVEEVPEVDSGVQVKMHETHVKVDTKGHEKPEVDVDVLVPEVSAAVPEGIEGKFGITTPELEKPAGRGFMAKMFSHSPKGKDSIEYTSGLVGDVQLKLPEADLEVDVKGPEMIQGDVLKEKNVTMDLAEGMEGKVEIDLAEVEKPSDSGFMSKMAELPKKMFPHSSKGEVSLEEAPEVVSDVPANMPEAHLNLQVKDPERPVAEANILLPESEVMLNLSGGIEGKVEVTPPEVGKPSDAGFVSKISKLPKKLRSHGKKAGTSFEEPMVTAEGAHVDIPHTEATMKIEAKLPSKPEASADIGIPAGDSFADTSESVAGKLEIDFSETGKAPDKGFMSKMAKLPKKMFHHGPKGSSSTDEHSTPAEATDIKMPDLGVQLQTHAKTIKRPEADVSVSVYEKDVTVQLPEGSKGMVEISTSELVGEHVPDGATQGADVMLPGMELPTMERRETKETPGGVVEVIEVTTHEVSKPSSPGLLSKVSKIPKKIFPRGSKSKSSDEESPSTPKRELKETPGGIVEVIEVTKHDVAKPSESKHIEQDGTKISLKPASFETAAGSKEGFPPTHMTREIKEVPGGVVEVVKVTKHVVGKLPEDKHSAESRSRMVDPSLPWEAELAKDPSAVVKRQVKETPEGHVEVVQVIRREAGDVPFASDIAGDGSDGTISRRIETTVVDGKPTIIRRLVTTTSDGVQQVTEHIEQRAEELGNTASSLFAKMGEFAKGLSSDDPSAVTTREVKKLPDGSVEVVSITKRSSSSPGKETAATEHLPSSTSGSMHFAESAAGKPMEAKTAIVRREISGPETIVCTTTSVVTSATASGSSKPELSADVLDKMFGDIGKPKMDDRLKDVLTAEGGIGAKREVTPEEAELLAQLFPEQTSGVAVYPPAGLVPEAAIIPEYRCMMTTEGPPLSPHDPESKEKVLLKLGRALSQDDLDAPSPTRGEAALTVAGLGEAVDASDQVEEPVVEKLELARRESKRYSQEFEQDEPLPKAMGFKTKPSEETVVSSTQVKGIHDNGTVKHTVTTVTKTTIIQEVEEPAGAPRPGESETWASDLDTSQVSVSSLPEDERTEPTLSSSATTATADAEALSGPLARTQVEEKEWTETDPDSGEVRHIISKTTHTTVTSMKPGEGAPRGDTMSTSISHSSKGSHGGSAASAPSRHDEAESLTFFQKKEFFEKLSEQSPLQETLGTRLGSTPSLDTALTRPVVTVKPRPRSESLTSQGEIVEENIVFAERLRLFQNGAQVSSLPVASLPHLDLMDKRRQSREQKFQDMPEMAESLQQIEGQQDTDGKSDTRLLVHTSDADKEAFDVRSVQSSADIDQQFSRMRVRMPAPEECVSETLISSCELPGEKPSPLRDAYKDSLLAPQQEGSQTERRDAAVAEPSHAPSAAADPAASAGRSVGGRERSPLLEASPPEETAYCPTQDISPAQEYPEYLTPDMQVRVGVSPTEVQPAKEKSVRYSESSVESSSEVGSPCPPSQGGTAMAFENVAFAGEDVIDATSSPVEESSSPTGSRSPYEVVREASTEETAKAALLKAEQSLHHVGQEVCPRPQSLMAEERNEQMELQIKPTIFNEAFDHSPKETAPEKKELSEGLLGVGLLTVSDMTARTPESRRGDSDEDEEEWADHVMSKIRGRPIPPTPPASPRAVQSVEVHDELVTWEAPVAEQEEVHADLASDITAKKESVVKHDENAATDDEETTQPQLPELRTGGKRPQLEHIPSEISDEDLVEREQSPTHITATCRGDRKDSSSDRNSSPDSDGPRASGSHYRSASGVGVVALECGDSQKDGGSDKHSHESGDKGTQELDDKVAEEPEETIFVIEEEALAESSKSGLSYDDENEMAMCAAGTLSPELDSPPKKKDGDEGSSSGKLDATSPVVLRSKSKRTEKKSEKRSSRDMDTGHSGSETDHSHYYSFEMTSDSGKTPGASRPTSSEFDVNILSGQASSEYETCATSQDGEVSGSYATAAASSHDTSFATARSSLSGSSRGSAYSVDSESSGHLGSMEVSEASETIVASAHEELDSDNESERSKSVLREPYDAEIPESVIRGGVEHPFLPSWQPVAKEVAPTLHGPTGARPSSSEGVFSPFQSVVSAELGRSCTGWPSASSSTAQGDSGRSTWKTEILNGAGSPALFDGQRRLRPNDDYMASSHEEDQLSVSESSATQSEHTWQTSIETIVDAVEAQRLSCETEQHHRQSRIQNSVSLPFDEAVAAEDAEADHNAGDDQATPPFQEVNGPVEVEYVPEYDDLTAQTLRPVLEQSAPERQAEAQGAVAIFETSHGEVSSSRELDEQEDSTELREEGFYAETFQGDLSSEEVESAVDEALLQGRSSSSYNEYCDKMTEYLGCSVRYEVKNIAVKEPFERPATPEPVDEIDGEDDKGNSSQKRLDDVSGDTFQHVHTEESMSYDKTAIKQECPEDDRCTFLPGSGSHSFQDQPHSESVSSSSGRATADDVKLYATKCEDYILQMHQSCQYDVGLSNTSDESSYLPEEGMDVENVKLLASRLQEGNGGQQDFPYDLSYEHEYVGDVRAEYGDLYTHQEVEEETYDDERARTRGKRRLSPISDERGSTPDYDTLGGRRTFGKGSEKDDASTSSLMEFERLEAEMASGTKSSSVGSSDSFSGRQHQIRNGAGSEQDSVSVNSLTEFERLEKEIVEAEGVDTRLRGEAVPKLDEIDEGHESQASDPGHETTVCVENGIILLREMATDSSVNEEQYDGKADDAQSDEIQMAHEQELAWSRTERHFLSTRTESGHSVDSVDRQSSASTATQFDADSLRDREIDDSESNFGPDTPGCTQKESADLDSLQDSFHDSERYDSLQEVLSKDKDSLQLKEPSAEADSLQDDCNELQDSLYEARDIEWDSVRTEDDTSRNWHQFSSQIRTTELSPTLSRPASSPFVVPVVVERIDTLTWVDQESTKAFISDAESLAQPLERPQNDTLVSSTDSLEPSSSANTHATYQCDTDSMMSSLNSAEESTMVSSTDTLDREALHFAASGKSLSLEGGLPTEGNFTEEHLDYATTDPRQNKRMPAVGDGSTDDIEERFRECLLRSAASPTDEEQVEERQTIDEKGNLIVTRTVKRHVTSEPRLHTQTFAGPDAEQRSREFVASFSSIEPSSEKDECEGFDAAGNVVHVTQHVLVRPIVKTVTFTGPDARLQMREYMRNLAGCQQSSAENTPTSDSGVGVCSSRASPQPLVPDPPATAPSSACPGLQRLSGGDHWMEAESALDDSSRPVTATRVITTRTTRTVGPDGREQLVTTTTEEEEGAGGDDPELRMRRSMQGVLDSFMADPSAPAPHSDEEE
ncbi:uncharacterized protein [Dermacentor albipictus]|uniref:uncharacterized protein isoform X5 n=1 Tax=Dermacentor albipictus TaxID=60249 RepID=UPI0038FD1511